jgi:hypothetical protein
MADGDITAVKVLYKHELGGGKTTAGAGVQSKVLVVGEITATYVSTGIACNKQGGPSVFGVTTLDYVSLEPRLIAAAVGSTAESLFHASYDYVNNKIFMQVDVGAANPAVPSDADAIKIRFLAVGDSANTPVFN